MITRKKWAFCAIPYIAAFLIFLSAIPAWGVTKIMPLGDSITRGHYGSTYDWGYRQPLYVSLISDGYNFDFVGSKFDGSFPDPNHEGRDGWKANEILNGRPSVPSEGKLEIWLTTQQPDVVLLHIGTNDITAGDQDANEINAILNCIDDYEQANDKPVTVVLALIINRNPYNAATTAFNNDVNNMALSRIANGDDIIVVDMENALDYSTDMYWDGLHPNDDGYAKMAAVWYNALTDCVDKFVYSIYGQVLEIDGSTPLAGVFVDANNGDSSDTTDVNGCYELTVSFGWSGTVEPNKTGWIFEPDSDYFDNVTSNINDVN
jgi:lysophospholipase L1-like esterase